MLTDDAGGATTGADAGERARIEKELAQAEAALAAARGRLADETFLAKAPPNIVDGARTRSRSWPSVSAGCGPRSAERRIREIIQTHARRRGLVADRGRLPDLSRAASRTPNGDGIGDLAGIADHLDHFGDGSPTRSPSTPSGSRRSTPRRTSTSATTSPTTSASIPRYGTLADFDRLVEAAHRRGIRIVMDLVLNHSSSQHAWFQASRASRDGPFRRLVHLARLTRSIAPRRSPAAQQLAVILRWLRLDLGRIPAAVLHAHVPSGTARPQLAEPGGSRRAARRRPDVAGSRRRRLPPRRLQRLLQGRAAPLQSVARRATGALVLAAPHSRPRPARHGRAHEGPPCDRRRTARPDDGRGAVRRHGSRRPRRLSSRATSCSTGHSCSCPGAPRHSGGRSRSATRPSGRTDGRPTCSRTTTSRGTPAGMATACRRRSATRRAKVAAALLLTLRGTPFLYYGEEIGQRNLSIPSAQAFDPPARRSSFLFPWWNRDQARGPMSVAQLAPAPGSPRARRGCRSRRTPRRRNVAVQAADPTPSCQLVSPAAPASA